MQRYLVTHKCYTFTHNRSSGTTSKMLPSATARYFMLCFDRDFLASTPSRRDMWRLLLYGKPRKKRVTAGGWNNGMLWGSNGEASETFFGRGQLNRFWNWKIFKDEVDDLKSLFDVWFWCGRVCLFFFRLMWMVSNWCPVVRGVYYCPCKVWSGNWRLCTPRSGFWTCRSIGIFGVYQSVPILCMKGHFFGVIEIPWNSTPCKDWLLDLPSTKKPGNVQWEKCFCICIICILHRCIWYCMNNNFQLYIYIYCIDSHEKCYFQNIEAFTWSFCLDCGSWQSWTHVHGCGWSPVQLGIDGNVKSQNQPKRIGMHFFVEQSATKLKLQQLTQNYWVEIPFGVFSCNGIHWFQERLLARHSTQAPVLFLNQGNGAASW